MVPGAPLGVGQQEPSDLLFFDSRNAIHDPDNFHPQHESYWDKVVNLNSCKDEHCTGRETDPKLCNDLCNPSGAL